MAQLSRVETMLIVEETGKYSAVVIGALTSGDAARALALVQDDINTLNEKLLVAQKAAQYLVRAVHGSACDYPVGGPCSCEDKGNPPVVGFKDKEGDNTDGLTEKHTEESA